MTRNPPSPRTATRRIRRLLVVGLMTGVAGVAAALGHQSEDSSSPPPSAESSSPAPPSSFVAAPPSKAPRTGRGGRPGKADGVVPGGVTVFDDRFPAVANLDPDLLRALRRAAADAADDDVTFYVNSGWRSPKYQNRLLRDAVSKYGSEEEAARWVATATTSLHVSGDAVDVGPPAAAAWLAVHGAGYGLCRIYRNEPWHYELRSKAIDRGCPQMYADPTQDPRMQQ